MSESEDAKDAASGAGTPGAPARERLDEDGLPLDREPTLDDVRSTGGSGRALAVGCTAAVVLLVLLFWVLRGGLLG